jgi:hypothetical protein
MRKRWKALAALVLFFLVLMSCPGWNGGGHIGWYIWIISLNLIPAYAISLLFSPTLTPVRRLSTAYLALVGFTYLLAGLLRLDWTMGLISDFIWAGLISPYLPFSLVEVSRRYGDLPISRRPYDFVPPQNGRWDMHYGFATAVVLTSVLAIVAAFGMAKSIKAAYWIWSGLVAMSIISVAAYVLLAYSGLGFREIWVQLAWEASYILAFVLARCGADLTAIGTLSDVEEW